MSSPDRSADRLGSDGFVVVFGLGPMRAAMADDMPSDRYGNPDHRCDANNEEPIQNLHRGENNKLD
jgi:hypothetical protein